MWAFKEVVTVEVEDITEVVAVVVYAVTHLLVVEV
jgi:hypothetical protein